MKPAHWILVVFSVAVVIGLLQWMDRGERHLLPELRGPAREAPTPGGPNLVAGAEPQARVATERPIPETSAEVREAHATLELRFRSAYDGRILPDVDFELYAGDAREPRAERADGVGVATLVVPAGESLAVWVDPAPHHGYAELELEELPAAGQAHATVEIPTDRDLDWYARAEWKGEPVPARVTVFEFDEARAPSVLEVLETDALGEVHLQVPSWRPIDVRFQAPGRGVALLAVEAGHESPREAQVVPLRPTASLRVIVEDRAGEPLTGVRVVVGTNTLDLSPDPSVDPYGRKFRAEGVTGAGGDVVLEDLPAGSQLEVQLFSESRLVRREEGIPHLSAGERGERIFRIGEPGRVLARVLDENDRPVAGARVGLVPGRRGTERRIQANRGTWKEAEHTALTDSAGLAVVERVPLGAWTVGCADAGAEGKERVALAEPVDVSEPGAEVGVTLRLRPGLPLAGRLVDENGTGVPEQRVSIQASEFAGYERTTTGNDGTFRFFPTCAGIWSLSVGPRDGWIAPARIEVAAGCEDLEIVLRRGASIRGKLHGGAAGLPEFALVTVYALDSETPNAAVARQSCTDGSFAVGVDAPGRYALVVTTEDGRVAVLDDLALDALAKTVSIDVELEAGVPVAVRYAGAAESCTVLVTQGGATLSYVLFRSGTTEYLHVPPGVLRVRVEPEGEPISVLHRVVERGPDVEIVVE